MKMFRKDEGFTLVELMVVVLIIGILVAIAIPVFNTAKANAQKRSCQANLRTVDGAVQTYLANDPANVAPTTWTIAMTDLVPDFIKVIPTCAAGGTYAYGTSATCTKTGHTYP